MKTGQSNDIQVEITDEAILAWPDRHAPRVEVLTEEGSRVAQGSPVARLRAAPDVCLVAPMAGTVANVALAPGHRLTEIKIFRDDDAGRHGVAGLGPDPAPADVRRAMQAGGLWPRLRSRPFGRVPGAAEAPAAIFVMGIDTRPGAADPLTSLAGREEAFARGLSACLALTGGPVFLCLGTDDRLPDGLPGDARLVELRARPRHPEGLAGAFILRALPARPDRPVWEVHAEDVADLGDLIETGLVPETRCVAIGGPADGRPRVVRCQPGADLRALTWRDAKPGPHRLVSGSALDGRPARWLGLRDRQVTVLGPAPPRGEGHWLWSALRRASRPLPFIPTAALDRAIGGSVPAPTLLRAIASGDRETAVGLGALSLLGEDLALADYVTGAEPRFAAQFEALLDAVAAEEAA